MSLHVSATTAMDKQSASSLSIVTLSLLSTGATFSNPVHILGNVHIVPERLALRTRAMPNRSYACTRTADANSHMLDG